MKCKHRALNLAGRRDFVFPKYFLTKSVAIHRRCGSGRVLHGRPLLPSLAVRFY